jgi:hypothetical protein
LKTSRKPQSKTEAKKKESEKEKAEKAYRERLAKAPPIPQFFSNPLAGLHKPVGVINQRRIVYDPNFHPIDYVQHCREGNTHTYILACWGITSKKFTEWKNKYPKFAEAATEGRVCFNAFWHDKFRRSMTSSDKNDKVNTLAFIWFSKNTMGWGEQPQDEFSDASPDDDFILEFEDTDEQFDHMMQPVKK